jgi:putative Mn2+ efflux pump MntP
MRSEPAILIVPLAVAAAVVLGVHLALVLGVPGASVLVGWSRLIAVTTFLVVFLVCLMASSSESIREFVKQIAVWLGILVLLPMSVWYGTSAFSPPPDWKHYSKATSRLDEKIRDATSEADKDKLRQERDRIDAERDEAERVFYADMFWLAYPTGLLAILLGTVFPVQAVGAGLMFGGLASLTAGCYAYWDRMGDWLRFGSLVLALLVLLILGTWRFRPSRSG